jgi:hypothetical protein
MVLVAMVLFGIGVEIGPKGAPLIVFGALPSVIAPQGRNSIDVKGIVELRAHHPP